MSRRSEMPSTTNVESAQFGPLQLESYQLRVRGASGVGLSIYIDREELMRFDCLGETGHYHVNMEQSFWVADGNVQRFAFLSSLVRQQVFESIQRLRADLANVASCNWRETVRSREIKESEIASASEWAQQTLAKHTDCDSN